MRKNLQFAGVTALLLSSAACGGQEIILSNYPGNDATSSTVDSLINGSKAMGFTMPDSPYFIYFEVTLRLDILEQGTQPRVEVFDDVGGTPGVSLATLLSPTIDTVGLGDFTFKQDSMVWLEPSESYWLVVSAESGWFNWMASDPPQDPSIWAQHLGSVWGTLPAVRAEFDLEHLLPRSLVSSAGHAGGPGDRRVGAPPSGL